jgi:hypothetical protein
MAATGKADRGASQVVRGFIEQYADGAFDPAVISILEDAFDDAWRRVQASKAPSSAEEYAPAARMILAKYIIEAAQTGEWVNGGQSMLGR